MKQKKHEYDILVDELAHELQRVCLVFAEANAEVPDVVLSTILIAGLSGTFISAARVTGLSFKDIREGINECINIQELSEVLS